MRHLRLSLYGSYDAGDTRHPQIIVRELGIKYIYAIPQSISDQWWFLGATNIPDELPDFFSDLEFGDPSELVGYGLDTTMANTLRTAIRECAT